MIKKYLFFLTQYRITHIRINIKYKKINIDDPIKYPIPYPTTGPITPTKTLSNDAKNVMFYGISSGATRGPVTDVFDIMKVSDQWIDINNAKYIGTAYFDVDRRNNINNNNTNNQTQLQIKLYQEKQSFQWYVILCIIFSTK